MSRHGATSPDTIVSENVSRSKRRAPAVLRAAVWERDEGICGLCGKPTEPDDFELDHIVPHALGGLTAIDNLRVAHRRCNRFRGQPLAMSDEAIRDAADEWSENEVARRVFDEEGRLRA